MNSKTLTFKNAVPLEKRFQKALGLLVLAVSCASPAFAQLVVAPLGASPPSSLVTNLLVSGIAFSNVQYQGTTLSSGTFTGGTSVIGFDNGIILSTGQATSVVGVNTDPANTINGLAGDMNLETLAGVAPGKTHDATVLEFDFIPTGSQLTFQYVFASKEYNNFVGSVNDVFGFFLNGVNVAVLPGTGTFVSINNVNNCANSAYFINNTGQNSASCTVVRPVTGLNTSMNGLTTVLTVNAIVNPGITNHIKLAIADMSDSFFDSNVFIRAQSFIAGQPTNTPTITPTNTPTNSPTITLTPTPTCVTQVWPNPYNPTYAVRGTVKVGCLPPGSTVTFFTLSAEKVRQLQETNSQVEWDGRNEQGTTISAGTYYYVVQSGELVLTRGKILIVRP